MRSEDEARMNQLPKMIADEEDASEVKVLAFELERLLSIRLVEHLSMPQPTRKG